MSLMIDNFKPLASGQIRAVFDVTLPSGLCLHGCKLMTGARGFWVALPSKPMLDRNGVAMTGPDGKRKFEPCVGFTRREASDRFAGEVIQALRVAHPEVFGA